MAILKCFGDYHPTVELQMGRNNDVPNIGPMAQDFKAAFYPGRDDKGISTLEFDGVELAAIRTEPEAGKKGRADYRTPPRIGRVEGHRTKGQRKVNNPKPRPSRRRMFATPREVRS